MDGLDIYEHWKQRIITPVPKEEGNFSLDRARPLVLLEVLQKAFWAIMTARLTKVWESRGLLNDLQFGFRKGRSVTAPALMATLIAEEQVTRKFTKMSALSEKKKTCQGVYTPGRHSKSAFFEVKQFVALICAPLK